VPFHRRFGWHGLRSSTAEKVGGISASGRAREMIGAINDPVAYVGVVTVNWNGWADTLECLEAVLRMRRFGGPVLVIDNGSDDASVDLICAWAAGALCVVPQSYRPEIAELTMPPIEKPIAIQIVDCMDSSASIELSESSCRLFVVRVAENMGFAVANNIGIRALLDLEEIEFVWLSNNDALPRRDALSEFLSAIQSITSPFLAGATILEYWSPEYIQSVGGRYHRYLGISTHAMAGQHASLAPTGDPTVLVDYPIGAAMFFNKAFIQAHGLMSEDYFLYCEEVDWVLRMGWPSKAMLFPRTVVYHKGGSATAAGRTTQERSLLADYYMLRNRLLLARKVSLVAFVVVTFSAPVLILRRLMRKRKGATLNAIIAIGDGIRGRKGKRKMPFAR
jgi:GT2 family glycosyltransferase